MNKNITLRIPEEIYDRLSSNDQGINQTVLEIIEEHQQMLKYSEDELKGKFSPEEWTALIDLVNSRMLVPQYICVKSLMMATIEDGEKFEGTLTRHGADLDTMRKKVETLTAAQTAAMMKRAKRFWEKPGNNIEEWSNF